MELARELCELLPLVLLPGLGAFLRDPQHWHEYVFEGVVQARVCVGGVLQAGDGRVEEHACARSEVEE